MNDTHDFLLEKRLQNEAPDLHRRVTDSVSMLYTMLESFLSWFPDFTDHIELIVSPTEPRFVPLVENLAEKIRQTLAYCRDVAQKRSDLRIYQEDVRITTM